MSKIRNTINYLKTCQRKATQGEKVHCTTDSHWLVNMAINRRAGWPDDPSFMRGSAMPDNGKYPIRYSGDRWQHLRLLADKINTPRLIVRLAELGEWRKLLLAKIPDRFFVEE